MHKVLDGVIDVTSEPAFNPENNRWIAFYDDSTFVSDGDPYGRNTGKWIISDSTSVLFLDSDTDVGDDSYWIVSFRGDTMIWKGTNSDFTSRFTVMHLPSN